MVTRTRLLAACWICLFFQAGSPTFAVEPSPPAMVDPWRDDAQLHDVQRIGDNLIVAVGDHGTIWTSRDAGNTWKLQDSGTNVSLYSVWFLNPSDGWIVGGTTEPANQRSRGIVLRTSDGGTTWTQLSPPPQPSLPSENRSRKGATVSQQSIRPNPNGNSTAEPTPLSTADESNDEDATIETDGPSQRNTRRVSQSQLQANDEGNQLSPKIGNTASHWLPRLRKVRFFTREIGIAAGATHDSVPTGVLRTEDGGLTWQPVLGGEGTEWLAADFINPDVGVLVGRRGETARLLEQRIDTSRRPAIGHRGIYDVTMSTSKHGWLAGDGALILTTTNGGLIWEAPDELLPDAARTIFDLRTVAAKNGHVWVAGEPGSVIWYSPDNGQSWHPQPTGDRIPLSAIHFSDSQHGVAVGSLGLILKTDDGGENWKACRGGNRRIAFWQLANHSRDLRMQLPVEFSGDLGYRSLLQVIAREDVGSSERHSLDLASRLREAHALAGGSAATICWQFPLAIPGLEFDSQKLVADWNRRNENRLEELMLGHFVRQIRTWRPTVIILDDRANAVGNLSARLMLEAVEQAADPTRFLEHFDVAGLNAWKVERVYQESADRSVGPETVSLTRHRLLPRLGMTNTAAARQYDRLLAEQPSESANTSRWARVFPATPDNTNRRSSDFFTGLSITPGSAARRQFRLLDEDQLRRAEEAARKLKNFSAVAERGISDRTKSAQLLAESARLAKNLPVREAADMLAELAQQYAQTGQWALAEQALVELATNYPHESVGRAAMQQLVVWWSSSELAWRRIRQQGTQNSVIASSPLSTGRAIEQAIYRLEDQSRKAGASIFNDDGSTTPLETTGRIELAGGENLNVVAQQELRDYLGQRQFWHAQAFRMARLLQRYDADLAQQPRVQFSMAAMHRAQGRSQLANELFVVGSSDTAPQLWRNTAQTERWITSRLAPPDFRNTTCTYTREPPLLDGVLSDPCWESAREIHMTASRADNSKKQRSFCFLTYDEQYLYWAGSLPRDLADKRPPTRMTKRRHDEVGDDQDRVTLVLDVDRDYHSSYQFSIDQRGATSDRCLEDATWNPKWFVAIDTEETHWRFEVAIPWSEISPTAPGPDSHWLMGCVRINPGSDVFSWAQPALPLPRPDALGLLQFE